jgi:hypothetical protein
MTGPWPATRQQDVGIAALTNSAASPGLLEKLGLAPMENLASNRGTRVHGRKNERRWQGYEGGRRSADHNRNP